MRKANPYEVAQVIFNLREYPPQRHPVDCLLDDFSEGTIMGIDWYCFDQECDKLGVELDINKAYSYPYSSERKILAEAIEILSGNKPIPLEEML